MLNGLWHDAAYAARQLWRQPGFSFVVVLTLAAALGVNAAFFSLFNTGSLRPWAVRDPDRVRSVDPPVSLAEWREWTERSRTLSGVTASLGGGLARVETRRLRYAIVSANHFDVLSPLQRGRTFSRDGDRLDGDGSEAVISDRLWREEFAAAPEVLGRFLSLDGLSFTVVGIADPSFIGAGQLRCDVWLPLAAQARLEPADRPRDGDELRREARLAVRLAPGATTAAAQQELGLLSRGFRAQRGMSEARIALADTRPISEARASEKALVGALFVALTLATLAGCANVANLFLARGYARRGEIAMRLALGAGRARVVRQLLAEAFLLAALGSVLSLAIADALPRWMAGTVPEFARQMPSDFRLDTRMLVYSLGLATLACVVFGLLPALQCTRLSIGHALKDAHGLSVPSLRTSLPVYQVIVSVMLLTASGLLVRSVHRLVRQDLGFSVEGLAFVDLELPRSHTRAQRVALGRGLIDELVRRAGPDGVAGASAGPSPGWRAGSEMHFDFDPASRHVPGTAASVLVAGSYFELLRMPTVAGRTLAAADERARVAVVNEAFARRYAPDGAVGRTFLRRDGTWEIVGVVRDAHLGSLETVEPVLFQPASPEALGLFIVRDSTAGVASVLRAAVERLDPAAYVEVRSGPAWLERASTMTLLGARLAGGVGLLTLALATLGLFSVAAYSVQQRTREIGLRVALGAQRADIVRAVLAPAGAALARGLVSGGVGAVAVAFLMWHWNLLMGLSPLDPVTYAGVLVTLLLAGAVASYVPARRALALEPADALRYQ